MADEYAIEQPARSIEASLTYCRKKAEKLVYKITEMGEEDPEKYEDWYVAHSMPVHDVRPYLSSLSLDREGFILGRAATAVTDFYDESEVSGIYDAEIERLVIEETGAEKAVIFDHTIRVESETLRREKGARETVPLVHNDYTVASGPQRLRELLDADEASIRLRNRFAIYNLWQPIRGPVQSSPLAICDARSVALKDWVACDLDYGDRVGEIYNVAFNANHRWYYAPNMEVDEILLFKSYDSVDNGKARFTPHTAFDDPTAPAGACPRESIETRVLAFFPSP